MATKKVSSFPESCAHPDHKVEDPGEGPGEYEHTCDGCGEVTNFWVSNGGTVIKTIRVTPTRAPTAPPEPPRWWPFRHPCRDPWKL